MAKRKAWRDVGNKVILEYNIKMTDLYFLKKRIIADLKTIKPQKIILFGSLTGDHFQENKSDIDLLIIKNTNKRPADRYSEARLSLSANYPFDIFVLTEKEFQDKISNSFFFKEIADNGEVIYEKQ